MIERGFDVLQKPVGIAGRPAGHPLFGDEVAKICDQAFAIPYMLARALNPGCGIHDTRRPCCSSFMKRS